MVALLREYFIILDETSVCQYFWKDFSNTFSDGGEY